MQYIYDKNAGLNTLSVDNEVYKYLFRARRHKIGDEISFRNLKDGQLYNYEVVTISKKEADLALKSQQESVVEASKKLHIIWSVVDSKIIEKQLPYLNEMGVDKISFFYADYSQKNFKLNLDKYEKILINSSQQCGRSSIIRLNTIDSLENYLISHPKVYMLNFSKNSLSSVSDIQTIVIGCEGGFSKSEVALFNQEKIIGLNSNLILKSETAITAVAAKILL